DGVGSIPRRQQQPAAAALVRPAAARRRLVDAPAVTEVAGRAQTPVVRASVATAALRARVRCAGGTTTGTASWPPSVRALSRRDHDEHRLPLHGSDRRLLPGAPVPAAAVRRRW